MEHSVECIEEELDVRGTDIELELSNMLEYYNDLLLKERGNIEEQEKIKDLIEEIENQIENHTKYRAVESFRGENNDYEEVITITDRYDFALAPYNNIAGVAVYMMYKAQQYGLLVPYKVKIKELY